VSDHSPPLFQGFMPTKLRKITESIRKTSFEVSLGDISERVQIEYRSPTPRMMREAVEALKAAEEAGEARAERVEYLTRMLVRIEDGDEMVEVTPELLDELPLELIRLIYEAIVADITPKKTN
jgi:3-hydroxyacyl-CoA dehydrogenase